MARNISGVYSLPAGSLVANGDTSDATDLNTPLQDIESDLNTPRPIVAGGTGASTASGAMENLGFSQVSGYASQRRLTLPSFTGGQKRILSGQGTTGLSGLVITFDPPFTEAPHFVATAFSSANAVVTSNLLSSTQVTVLGWNPATGAAANLTFNWIAFGE